MCYTNAMSSKQINFRPTEADLAILRRLSKRLGINQTAVIRQALRCLDKKEGGK